MSISLLQSSFKIVPIGTILPYMGMVLPSDSLYLFCDGSTYDIQKYPELYSLLQQNTLPFLTATSIIGSGTHGVRQFVSENTSNLNIQDINLPVHTHAATSQVSLSGTHQHTITNSGHSHVLGTANPHVHSLLVRSGTENRPTYISSNGGTTALNTNGVGSSDGTPWPSNPYRVQTHPASGGSHTHGMATEADHYFITALEGSGWGDNDRTIVRYLNVLPLLTSSAIDIVQQLRQGNYTRPNNRGDFDYGKGLPSEWKYNTPTWQTFLNWCSYNQEGVRYEVRKSAYFNHTHAINSAGKHTHNVNVSDYGQGKGVPIHKVHKGVVVKFIIKARHTPFTETSYKASAYALPKS